MKGAFLSGPRQPLEMGFVQKLTICRLRPLDTHGRSFLYILRQVLGRILSQNANTLFHGGFKLVGEDTHSSKEFHVCQCNNRIDQQDQSQILVSRYRDAPGNLSLIANAKMEKPCRIDLGVRVQRCSVRAGSKLIRKHIASQAKPSQVGVT